LIALRSSPRRFVWLALAALATGITLAALTWWLARSGPEASGGGPWSLRGNGAIIVPLGIGPALLAGTWTAVALHARGAQRWLRLGAAAGVIGLALVMGGLLALVGWGRSTIGQIAANWLFLSVFGWMVVAPLLAAVVRTGRRRAGWAIDVLAGLLATMLLIGGCVATQRVLPPGS
jgi:hypothetical protein